MIPNSLHLLQSKIIKLLFCISIILCSCEDKKDSDLDIELYSDKDFEIENLTSIYLTNKPMLSSGGYIFFWDKWGLHNYKFENIKLNKKNTFFIENIEADKYTVYINMTIDGNDNNTMKINDLEVNEGHNSFKRKLTLDKARRYIESR